MIKMVRFHEYCKDCKHEKLDQADPPCVECLSICAREDSHKPEYFEPKNNAIAEREKKKGIKAIFKKRRKNKCAE